jgi:hypothetical protein
VRTHSSSESADARRSPRGETIWLRPVNASVTLPTVSLPVRLAVIVKTRFSRERVIIAS